MKSDKEDVLREWERHLSVTYNGRRLVIDNDQQIPRIIVPLDGLVAEVARSSKALFKLKKTKLGECLFPTNDLAKRVVQWIEGLEPEIVRQYLDRHEFSPYFVLWEEKIQDLRHALFIARHFHEVGPLNACIDTIRSKARKSTFRVVVRRQERAARKNWLSLRNYFKGLFRVYGKLLIVRVDLGYRNDPMEFGWNWIPPDDKVVKADLVKLLRYVRRSVPHLAGYVWKLEYGSCKGHHVHAILICDGHETRDGVGLGKLIGEKWEAITNGAGSYWNCNAKESDFKRRGCLGIGLIEYWREELREGLERVGKYLAKSDCYARFKSPDIGRTFGKAMIKRKPSNVGRPRMYVEYDAVDEAA